jgi:hypothetical protein
MVVLVYPTIRIDQFLLGAIEFFSILAYLETDLNRIAIAASTGRGNFRMRAPSRVDGTLTTLR